ncbi:MAG: sugar kinase [Firmicutes bacterium]|nr:sugar kinase [Bacillota bacterium]
MTIKDIAKLAGVSISTVSKIMNNKDENINIETRNRVLKIVKEYNYSPYASSVQASTTKTFLLGVLLNTSFHSSQFTQGIVKAAQGHGYAVLLFHSMDSLEEELKSITTLCKNKIDCLIWEPVIHNSLEHTHFFTEKEIPIHYVNCPNLDNSYNIDFVKMGYTATQSMVNYHHTKIAFLMKDNSIRSELAFEGFKRCLFDNEITYTNNMLITLNQPDYISNMFANHFTGVVSSHYAMSLKLCEDLDKLQYSIPYDISLVSLRDDLRENISYPTISSIKIPYHEFGLFVGNHLIQTCEKNEIGDQKFDTEYVLENTSSIDIPVTERAQKIIVVGSINIDTILNVDTLPQPGRTISSNSTSVNPGGKGVNQAVGVAKLNHPVSLIGRVGNDYEATLVYNSMSEYKIDVQGIKRDISSETGKAYIHVQGDGESTISLLSGANHKLSPKDIRVHARLFENTSYCLLQTEVPLDTIIEAAKIARSHSVKTILKPAALKFAPDELMKHITIFIPNEKESDILCPEVKTPEEKADYFLSKGIEVVIITLGSRGCFVKDKDFSRLFPAVPFTAIDTTGAADAFISSLAVYLSCGYSLEKSIQIASYAAAFCVNRQGVVPALVDRNTLECYIKNTDHTLL